MRKTYSSPIYTIIVAAMFLVTGCSADGIKKETKYPTSHNRELNPDGNIYNEPQSILGDDGLSLFGGKSEDDSSSNTGIGVNGYLWRASLDTVSFMPLASADPFGGVIITDWYAPDESKGERFKLNVFISEKKLKANGVKVTVFKQSRSRGQWKDSKPSEEMGRQLEETILTRARELRIAEIEGR